MSSTMSSGLLPSPLYVGTGVTATCTFTNPVAGQSPSAWPAVDPTQVTLTVQLPGGSSTTYTYGVGNFITRVSTGVYSAELNTAGNPGRWLLKWIGTNACAAVWVAGFLVTPVPI